MRPRLSDLPVSITVNLQGYQLIYRDFGWFWVNQGELLPLTLIIQKDYWGSNRDELLAAVFLMGADAGPAKLV